VGRVRPWPNPLPSWPEPASRVQHDHHHIAFPPRQRSELLTAVRNERPGTLTIGRTDALWADLASQPSGRYAAELA
jgi:hypothetical protein